MRPFYCPTPPPQKTIKYILTVLQNSHNITIYFKKKIESKHQAADHVLTLRTLVDKYVHHHNKKIYACFVNFKEAFDSVWHDGPFFKLLQ